MAAPFPELNALQLAAATYAGRHLLIQAGPGTGKTHTLAHRIAFLAERLDAGQRVLAVTFTVQAAAEMRGRLERLLPSFERSVKASTFHGFCLELLRSGAGEPFKIAPPETAAGLLARRVPGLGDRDRRALIARSTLQKSLDRRDDGGDDLALYDGTLRSLGYLDYEDLIIETIASLEGGALDACVCSFPFLCVDEYQDINPLQHRLVKLLARAGARVTAIGDANQAIYGFRGSDAAIFRSFTEDFPGAERLSLRESYRTPVRLVAASSQLIAAGDARRLPDLVLVRRDAGRLVVHRAASEAAEAEYVVHQVERLVGGTSLYSLDSGRVGTTAAGARSFGDIAVLYRVNGRRRRLEEAFRRSGIPYRTSGDLPLSRLPGVHDLLVALDLVAGRPSDEADERFSGEEVRRGIEALSRIRGARGVPALLDEALGMPGIRALMGGAGEEDIESLRRRALLAPTLESFLDDVALSRPEDPLDRRSERVALMTLHAAKGLEFPTIFIVGCEEGSIPLRTSGSDEEEERRLLYVAMTRPREELFITWAAHRGAVSEELPSSFLSAIDDSLVEHEAAERKRGGKDRQLPLFDA